MGLDPFWVGRDENRRLYEQYKKRDIPGGVSLFDYSFDSDFEIYLFRSAW